MTIGFEAFGSVGENFLVLIRLTLWGSIFAGVTESMLFRFDVLELLGSEVAFEVLF